MSGRVVTRPHVAKCNSCRIQGSRLARTPFVNLKLPFWTIGFVLDQSAKKHPGVLTGAEIQRLLHITESSALRLKKRIQVFTSQQKRAVEQLFYSELKKRFHKTKPLLEQDASDINKLVTTPVGNLPIAQSDSVVLFSARERSNKGRGRFRHHGQTSSIYACDSLGGRQIGTMVQTTTWAGGPALYESIPNQKIPTLLPIIERQIPKDVPLFTDMALEWYKPHNRNHRCVNHNLPSKRGNGKSLRRYQQNGIHTQAAEGQHGVLKTAFRAYRYVKPEHSQLYLNEFSFWGALKYFGADRIAEFKSNGGRSESKNQRMFYPLDECRTLGQRKQTVAELCRKFLYKPPTLDERKELSPRSRAFRENREILTALGDSNPRLEAAISEHREFYENPTVSHQRRREKLYTHSAQKLWESLSEHEYTDLSLICREIGIPKRICHRIIARWSFLGIANVIDRTVMSRDNKERLFDVQRKSANLPHVLYMAKGGEGQRDLKLWQSSIKTNYPKQNKPKTTGGRQHERRWLQN